MTLVTINLKNVGSGNYPSDKVIFYSPVYREAPGGGIVSTAEFPVELANGVGQQELVPGPVTVVFQCKGIADTAPKQGTVPDSGTVDLFDVIGGSLTYAPPIITSAVETIRTELAEALQEISESKAPSIEITAGADWNTLISHPLYHRKYSSTTDVNAPTYGTGVLVVGITQNPSGMQTQTFYVSSGAGIYYRSRGSSGSWTAWVRVDQDVRIDREDILLAPAARRAVVVDEGLRRRGRVIGTGGKPAIALRFDHHLAPFGVKVLPLLKKYRLPWGQMVNSGFMGTGNDGWTWSQLATESHNSGGEVWNHSWSHSDVATDAQAEREVTRGLTELKAGLPSLWVDSFAPPGQPSMMGFEGQDTASDFWSNSYGRRVLAQHAFTRGYFPAVHQQLAGQQLIGQGHTTIDAQTRAWVFGFINGVISSGSGSTLMLHPTYLDQSGYLTTADLEAILSKIAAERDSGRLEVLGCAGILIADSEQPIAASNMLEGAGAGAITTSKDFSVSSRNYPDTLGVPHEASSWVRATTSGTISLRVQITSPTYSVDQIHTIAATAGVVYRLGVPVTPPLDTTAQIITITGNVTHTGVIYRPI